MNSYEFWSSISPFVICFIFIAGGISWLLVYQGINDLGVRFGLWMYRNVPRFWLMFSRGVRAITSAED